MKTLWLYDLKRSFPLKRFIITVLVAWTALFFFSQFFLEDMKEERLLEKLSIGIVDMDQSKMSHMLLSSFKGNPKFSALMDLKIGDASQIYNLYESGALTAVITIPSGFTKGLLHYENPPLSALVSPDHPLKAMILLEILSSYSDYTQSVDAATLGAYEVLSEAKIDRTALKKHNDLFSVEMVSFVLGRNQFFSYSTVDTFPATNSFLYFGAAILSMVIAFSSTGILSLVYEDIQAYCLQRYLMGSKSIFLWTISKIFAFSLLTTMLCFLISLPLFVYFVLSPILMAKLFIQIFIYALFYVSLLLFLGLLFFSQTASNLFSNLFVFLLGLVGGNFIPLPLMPKAVQNVSSFTPNYWTIRRILYTLSNKVSENFIVELYFLLLAFAFCLCTCAILSHFKERGALKSYA